jgi:hypothetical protein
MSRKPFGALVTAPDVERLPEDSGPTHFVRVCGALIRWALAALGAPSADIQISERINVPDRGVDAECTLPDSTLETGGFIGPGKTVFQFKYRDVGAADRRSIVTGLASRLRQELSGLPVDCDRYVLMTNVSLAGVQVSRLRKAIVNAAPVLAMKPVIVWGAAEIANALNASPGLRHLFAAAGGLSTVEVAEAELKAAYGRVGWAPFVNRARELSILHDFIESDAAGVLTVRGPQFSGRTRLVLEAVKRSAPLALWAVAAEHVDVDLLRDLDSGSRKQLLILDDDRDDEAIRRVVEWGQQRQQLKVIVITRGEPSRPDESSPSCLDVSGMEKSDADILLRTLAPALPFGDRSWIFDGSDGLPGLIAHAAALLPGARLPGMADPEGFRRSLGDLLTQRYEAALGPDERRALQIASVLPVLGVEGSAAAGVTVVAKALDVDPGLFATHRLALERAGLLRRRGRFVEVVPPLLADHLASRALTSPERVIAELDLVLTRPRFCSFLERLARLPGEGVRRSLERFLSERCSGLEDLLRNSELIRTLAPAAPRVAMTCIEDALRDRPVETMATALEGDARHDLARALEDLAYRSETFERAAGQLLILAEAEKKSYGNNAIGVLLSLFHWGHPDLPASLSQRLDVLERGAASDAPGHRKIVADAAGAAFKREFVRLPRLHHPRGPQLPEPSLRPETLEDIDRYGRGVIELLRRLLHDNDAHVRAAAATSVTDVFRPMVFISLRSSAESESEPSELALKAFAALADVRATAESAATYQVVATVLELLLEQLPTAAPDHSFVKEIAREAEEMRAGLVKSFRGRLWRLIGPASWAQRQHWRDGTRERQDGIQGIATEFLQDPKYPALFESHLDWLKGTEAHSSNELFHVLGRSDTRRGLWAALIAATATAIGEERLSVYFRGWAEHDREGARAEADRLIASRPDLTRVLLSALATLFRGREIVERARRLLDIGALERHEFATMLASVMPWEELGASEAEDLFTMMDDGTPRVRGALLVAFAVRCMRGGELNATLRKLAWSFLEASCSLEEAPSQFWWDQLAAQLGEAEPQRLLRVVEILALYKADRGGMAPHLEIPLAFETLRKTDRRGLIPMLLGLTSQLEATSRLDTIVEDEIDPLVDREALLAFARGAGVEGARAVAQHLNPEKPGFWEVARDLLAEWGNDDRLRQRLLSALPGGWSGSALPMIKERLDKAAALRSDPNRWVESWAREAMSFLEDWRHRGGHDEQEDWIWDYRIRRAEIEGMVRGPDSPDKLWAIGRLLEHAPRERVLDLLTPEEILKALDQLPQLPERVREQWEAWAKHWAGRH